MEKLTHADFMAMSYEDQQKLAQEAFAQFNLKEALGRIFVSLVNARQMLDHPLLSQVFSAPMSFLAIILRQKMLAGDFTEDELRTAVETFLIETDAPDEIRMFMTTAVSDFMKLGS